MLLLINSCSTSNVGVITFNDFVTDVVGSLEYCSAVASTAVSYTHLTLPTKRIV